MPELATLIDELKRCGDALIDISDQLTDIFSTKPDPPQQEQKPVTLEDVRTALAQKSLAGFTEEVRSLIRNHGADKLSGIDPKEYASLLAEVNQLS